MLGRVTDLLHTLETYYDAAPRPSATTEQVGPFTLFVKTDPDSWDFYARPALGLDTTYTAADVAKVQDRQLELGLGQNLEWVHQTTPTLLEAARAVGMKVEECPLLVLPDDVPDPLSEQAVRLAVLGPDSPDLAAVTGAIHAGFEGTDDFTARTPGRRAEQIRSGLLVVIGAYDGQGNVVGGGSHSPRGTTTELTGIAVLPRARRRGTGAAITQAPVEDAKRRGIATTFLSAQDDAVARVYERVGFTRVGTACIAEAAEVAAS
jgi:ribosomal protein S18 acetylase RimI-like enzyme